MYAFLAAVFGERWAGVIAALCYAAMAVCIAYCIFEPQADFRYLAL